MLSMKAKLNVWYVSQLDENGHSVSIISTRTEMSARRILELLKKYNPCIKFLLYHMPVYSVQETTHWCVEYEVNNLPF